MATLGRRIGLGLAARGEVDDVVAWAAALAPGVESVWIHDSYFERDAVTYASASAVASVSSAPTKSGRAGALNPFTRHPVALAMTGQRWMRWRPAGRNGFRDRACRCV